jgi:hypothetical protein
MFALSLQTVFSLTFYHVIFLLLKVRHAVFDNRNQGYLYVIWLGAVLYLMFVAIVGAKYFSFLPCLIFVSFSVIKLPYKFFLCGLCFSVLSVLIHCYHARQVFQNFMIKSQIFSGTESLGCDLQKHF